MSKQYAKVYSGDSLRNLLFQYSCDRMDRDPEYRKAVRKAVAERKAQRRAREAEKAKANA